MSRLRKFLVLILPLILIGCGKKASSPPPMMAVPVKVQKVEAKQIADKIEFVGSLLANESVEIKSKAEGTVETIHFEEGQAVERREYLIELDREKLSASVEETKANLELTQGNFERSKTLLESRTISQQEFDQAKSNFESAKAAHKRAEQNYKDSRITAPFAGILGPRLVSPGQVITPGTVLTTLVNIDPVKVEFMVPERYFSRLKLHQALELQVDAFPDQTFRGEVIFISPQIDEQTRSALVKGSIQQDAELKLRPGMLGKIHLILDVKPEALVVTESALIYRGNNISLYVVDAQDAAQPRNVKTGIHFKGEVEILEGLKNGDRVVIEGHQKLMPGAKVMIPQSAPPAEQPSQIEKKASP